MLTQRLNVAVGLVAIATSVVVIPASVSLVSDSWEARETNALLRQPKAFEIRETEILKANIYSTAAQTESPQSLQLVSIVSRQSEADSVFHVWELAKAHAVVRRTGMTVFVSGIAEDLTVRTTSSDLTVARVKDPEDFSTRTGIRVAPFSLIIAADGHVLAAGPGLPDVPFIRDAAQRFLDEGATASTRFRPVTLEMNSSLRPIETLFTSSAIAR